MQQRIRDGIAAGDLLIASAKRDRHLTEGAGFLGLCGHLIEDQATCLIDVGAAFHQILGKAALEVQASSQIVDRGNAVALGFARAGRDRLGVGCGSDVGFLRLRLHAGLSGSDLRLCVGCLGFCHRGVLDSIVVAGGFIGRIGRIVGFVRHRDGSCLSGWDVPAMKDAVVKGRLGAKPCGGIRANGHGGHLEGCPVHRAPKFAGGFGFRDLEAVDLVAYGDRADVARLDIAPDRLDISAFADPDLSNAATVFDTRRTLHDRADHGIQRVDLMHLQKRRARIQPIQPHMGRVEAELFFIGLAE